VSGESMRGIVGASAYVPHWSLDRSEITAVLGSGRGRGRRSVASFDEDPLTLAVAAGRLALSGLDGSGRSGVNPIRSLTFATTAPVYLEKSSAPIVHAALALSDSTATIDVGPGLRSAAASLRGAFHSTDPVVAVLAGDVRIGLAGSTDELGGGDAGSAIIVGDATVAPVLAEYVASASVTQEFLDRWRVPGEVRVRAWEERFGQLRYDELATSAWERAIVSAGVDSADVARVAVSSPNQRAGQALTKQLAAAGVSVADRRDDTVGFTGAAHPGLLLAELIEQAEPGELVALVALADGADVTILRRTDVPCTGATVADQVEATMPVSYGRYLTWRGLLAAQPPNRPEPARMSATAAERRAEWKYGFVGSRDRTTGAVHLPPARVSFRGGAVDDMDAEPMAGRRANVATYTVDSLAYSPSPPVIFAVCDFEGGGRLPVELTDVSASEVSIGMEVEMTFRRVSTADGIANYFWKARPVPGTGGVS